MDKYTAKFKCQPWHPLTELPVLQDNSSGDPIEPKATADDIRKAQTTNHTQSNELDIMPNLSSNARKVLYDATFKLHLSASERIKELEMSARNFENAKHELITKGSVIESSAGKRKYLK